MTATEVFESVTNGGSSDFALLVRILDKHGRWCLVGGLAVNCYVEPVFTLDADVVVASSKLSAIQAELIANGFSIEEFEHSINAQNETKSGANLVHSRPALSNIPDRHENVECVGRERSGCISEERRSWKTLGLECSETAVE